MTDTCRRTGSRANYGMGRSPPPPTGPSLSPANENIVIFFIYTKLLIQLKYSIRQVTPVLAGYCNLCCT